MDADEMPVGGIDYVGSIIHLRSPTPNGTMQLRFRGVSRKPGQDSYPTERG
jgi:hypothetical protein